MIDLLRERWNRVVAVFRRTPLDADLDVDIATHLQQAIDVNVRSGMPLDEARRQALVRFGGVSQAVELHREARGLAMFEVLRQDLRFTMRSLRRGYALAAILILVLAFGIGANVAVFSVVNTILLRPLPFHDPNALVWLTKNSEEGGLSNQTYTVSAFEEFQRHNQSFQQVTSYQTFFNSVQYKLIGRGDLLPLVGVQVAENFFPTLGVKPVLGRLFTPDECKKAGPAAALLSHSFWQRQFGGDPAIVGKTISIQATPADISGPLKVIGVLPASFDFGAVFSPGMHVDFFVPAYMDFWRTWGNTLAVLGRLKPGVSLSQAQAEANILFPQLKAANKEWWTDYKSTLLSLRDRVTGTLGRSLTVLWCAVGLMLLIVCINVSNVFLARALSRGKEFAMRTALGAGRGRIVRQLLTESLALTGVGALLGFALAWVITAYVARQTWIALPLLATVRVDSAALAWTALIAISVGVIAGLAPALRIAGGNLQSSLKDSGAGISQGKRHERIRAWLVVSEVALACVLLVGAGLLLRSFVRLLDVDLGFRPAQVAAIKVEIHDDGNEARRGAVLAQMLESVRAIPGIHAAGMSDMLPLDRNRSWGLIAKENMHDGKPHAAFVYVVTPGYLETMGMRLVAGRDISWRDGSGAPRAIVINEAAARPMARTGSSGAARVRPGPRGKSWCRCSQRCAREQSRGEGQPACVRCDDAVRTRGR